MICIHYYFFLLLFPSLLVSQVPLPPSWHIFLSPNPNKYNFNLCTSLPSAQALDRPLISTFHMLIRPVHVAAFDMGLLSETNLNSHLSGLSSCLIGFDQAIFLPNWIWITCSLVGIWSIYFPVFAWWWTWANYLCTNILILLYMESFTFSPTFQLMYFLYFLLAINLILLFSFNLKNSGKKCSMRLSCLDFFC